MVSIFFTSMLTSKKASAAPSALGQYSWHLTIPHSIKLFNMRMAGTFCSHIMSQKSDVVCERGPWKEEEWEVMKNEPQQFFSGFSYLCHDVLSIGIGNIDVRCIDVSSWRSGQLDPSIIVWGRSRQILLESIRSNRSSRVELTWHNITVTIQHFVLGPSCVLGGLGQLVDQRVHRLQNKSRRTIKNHSKTSENRSLTWNILDHRRFFS